ncbi:SGNH hydrolase-type esterase domain-containing protein [Mycena olivaceomarginata]|nr:SGNH hydrolase-type esterase domain-containing protein [Mycena olivaceomarginata]
MSAAAAEPWRNLRKDGREKCHLFLLAASAAATVYLAGDSTMTPNGNNDGTAGWGKFLPDYQSLTVVNNAIAGRSARSFTREGRFTAMAANVKAGDYIVIEFGHNDGGSLTPTDNGRTDCSVGAAGYATTCTTVFGGVTETVLTYEAYLVNAAKLFQSKGANVIISTRHTGQPLGNWDVHDAATATGATFVDHGLFTAALYKNQGATLVDSYYPNDHTHTSPAGATVVARAFILALEATSSTLKNFITHD